MPPAVALLHYISSGIIWRIFDKLGYFAGFSLYIINFPVRISEAAMGGEGDIIFHSLGRKEYCVQYRVPEFLCCRMICNHPPTQVSVGELYIQGIERQRGEDIFHGKDSGGPKSYDSTETVVIYIIYYTSFSASLVQDDGNWRALRSIQRV